MLDKAIKYFQKEYEEIEKDISKLEPYWTTYKQKIIENTIHRCLGVALFVQEMGVEFEDVNPYYEEIREKLEKLLDIVREIK